MLAWLITGAVLVALLCAVALLVIHLLVRWDRTQPDHAWAKAAKGTRLTQAEPYDYLTARKATARAKRRTASGRLLKRVQARKADVVDIRGRKQA